jgi:hypothetical protein
MVPRRSTGYAAEIPMVEDSAKGRVMSVQSLEDDSRLPTRRAFLGLTTAGMVVVATPVVAATTSIANGLHCTPKDPLADPLDALLGRYGSEFGDITNVC